MRPCLIMTMACSIRKPSGIGYSFPKRLVERSFGHNIWEHDHRLPVSVFKGYVGKGLCSVPGSRNRRRSLRTVIPATGPTRSSRANLLSRFVSVRGGVGAVIQQHLYLLLGMGAIT